MGSVNEIIVLPGGATNWSELLGKLNQNFSTLGNSYVYKGDKSEMRVADISLLTNPSIAEDVKYSDFTDTGKLIFDAIFEIEGTDTEKEQKRNAISSTKLNCFKTLKYAWWVDDQYNYIVAACPITYIDPEFSNGQAGTATKDYSCIVTPYATNSGYAYRKSSVYPTFYHDPAAKGGRGAWCWKINGVETGIIASAADETSEHSGKLFLMKKDGTVNKYLYYDNTGAAQWCTYAQLCTASSNSYKPLNNDLGYMFEDYTYTPSGSSTTKTVKRLTILIYKETSSTTEGSWIEDTQHKYTSILYDDAYMKYIWDTIASGWGTRTLSEHEEYKEHGLQIGDIYIDTLKNGDGRILNIYNSYNSTSCVGKVNLENINEVSGEHALEVTADTNITLNTPRIQVVGLLDNNDTEIPIQSSDLVETINNNRCTPRKITWSELKTLASAGKLTPGRPYQITDYGDKEFYWASNYSGKYTTANGDIDQNMISGYGDSYNYIKGFAGHQFDIITTADSSSKLNETAYAVLHDGDTYFSGCKLNAWELKYDPLFNDDDQKKYDWVDSTIADPAWDVIFIKYWMDGTGGDFTLYDLFRTDSIQCTATDVDDTSGTYYLFPCDSSGNGNSKIKTEINNIASAEAWPYDSATDVYLASKYPTYKQALEHNDFYLVAKGGSLVGYKYTVNITYGKNISFSVDSYKYIPTQTPEIHGVVYYMKDEFGNECPYDFKNILFADQLMAEMYFSGECIFSLTPTFMLYDENTDLTFKDATLVYDNNVHNNKIYPYKHSTDPQDYGIIKTKQILQKNLIIQRRVHDTMYGRDIYIYNMVRNNIIKYNGVYNYIGIPCAAGYNHTSYYYHGNQNNTIGNNCSNNKIYCYCYNNSISDWCDTCVIYSRYKPSSGSEGAIWNHSDYNSIGEGSYIVYIYGSGNVIKKNCSHIYLEGLEHKTKFPPKIESNYNITYNYNEIGNNCHYIYGRIYFDTGSVYSWVKENCDRNKLGDNCESNTFAPGCVDNVLGNNCSHNVFYPKCDGNILESNCHYNIFNVLVTGTGTEPHVSAGTSYNTLMAGTVGAFGRVMYSKMGPEHVTKPFRYCIVYPHTYDADPTDLFASCAIWPLDVYNQIPDTGLSRNYINAVYEDKSDPYIAKKSFDAIVY